MTLDTIVRSIGTRSYQCQFIADSSGNWASNGLRFEDEDSAWQWARDLACRWTAVRDYRVVCSTDAPNK